MGRTVLVAISLALGAALLASGASGGSDTFVTVKQAQKRFAAASGGYPLVRNPAASAVGRYAALDLGVPTISKQVKFGQFTLFLVVKRDAQAEVDGLLADTHTGKLGRPDARGIHWEKGLTLDGQAYWLAKKRYGGNLVLWWYGPPVKKTDKAFANLNAILLRTAA
jgi:hypothetical protein